MEPVQTYYVGESITLRGWFLAGSTLGSIVKGQTLLQLQDGSALTLTNGAPIYVQGAGGLGGDLVTTVVSSTATTATLTAAALTDASRRLVGTPTDPTTTAGKVRQPDASEVTLSISKVSTGLYKATFVPTQDGDHYYRFQGSGGADRWRKFIVSPERVA